MKKNTNKWLVRLVAFAVIAAVMLAAVPSAVAGPHGPGPRHGPPPPAHHHHHHGGDFIAGAAIAGLTFGVVDSVVRLANPPPPPPPPPPAPTVVYSTPGSTVTYTTYTPAPVVYGYPPPPPPPPPHRYWRYGY